MSSIEFEKELHSLYDSKHAVSASKIQHLTKVALKHPKLYKNVVHAMEKFMSKCSPDLKLSGLYVMDSIIRAAPKLLPGIEGDHFIRRFEEKFENMVPSLLAASTEDKTKMKRVFSLWKKNGVFSREIIDVVENAYFPDIPSNSATNSPVVHSRVSTHAHDPRTRTLSAHSDSPIPSSTTPDLLSTLTTLLPTITNPSAPNPLGNLNIASLLPLLTSQPQAGALNMETLALLGSLSQLTGAQTGTPTHQQKTDSNQGSNGSLDEFDYGDDDEIRKPVSMIPAAAAAVEAAKGKTSTPPQRRSPDQDNAPSRDHYSERHHDSQRSDQHHDSQRHSDNREGDRHYEEERSRRKSASPPPHRRRESPPPQEQNQRYRAGIPRSMQTANGPSPISTSHPHPHHHAPLPSPSTKPAVLDPDCPPDAIKILSRTVYCGGITPVLTQDKLREVFSSCGGNVDTVIVNYAKFNCFVKFFSRAEAEVARVGLDRRVVEGVTLKVGWGCGFGPKDIFDYRTGVSIYPLAKMTETDKRWISTSGRGGGPLQGGTVVEEPDVGFSKPAPRAQVNVRGGSIGQQQEGYGRQNYDNRPPTMAAGSSNTGSDISVTERKTSRWGSATDSQTQQHQPPSHSSQYGNADSFVHPDRRPQQSHENQQYSSTGGPALSSSSAHDQQQQQQTTDPATAAAWAAYYAQYYGAYNTDPSSSSTKIEQTYQTDPKAAAAYYEAYYAQMGGSGGVAEEGGGGQKREGEEVPGESRERKKSRWG
ncbi:hypothetical protein HDV05_005196 [Chytridiales sp. JEL 0842]|nr:hypothetical protein HDV05_005196 [Chytridiales sp. JEL 0842]